MTQRQLHHRSPAPARMTAHKAGNLEHTAQPAGHSTGWRVALPGPLLVSASSKVAQLVSASSRQLVWSQSLGSLSPLKVSVQLSFCLWERDSHLLLLTLAGRGLVNLVHFRDFLKLFELFTSLLKELPCKMECFNLRGNLHNIAKDCKPTGRSL
jgi:hypothetical protein